MARSFNVLVFEGWLGNQVEIFTDPGLALTLGTADELRLQMNATDFSGASPTVVANYYWSNDNIFWDSATPAITYTTPVIAGPTQYFWTSASNWINGGFGRFGFKMGQTSTKAYVRVYACGRTK